MIMKTTNLFKSIIAIVILTAFVACTKQTDQVNIPKSSTLSIAKKPIIIIILDTTAKTR